MNLNFSTHLALQGLTCEQVAELALLGLRYRSLGAGEIDFNDPEKLDPYWTGKRMAEEATKKAVKAAKKSDPLASLLSGRAQGHLMALFNCSVIDYAVYQAQYRILLDRAR